MSEISNKTVWVVHDPQPTYEASDRAPYETTLGRIFDLYVGTGAERWDREHTSIYDNREEAFADARERWAKLQATRAHIREALQDIGIEVAP